MEMTFTPIFVGMLIATLVGVVEELLARWHTPDGMLSAILVGFFAMFLVVGAFHSPLTGEPSLDKMPVISSMIAATLLVTILSGWVFRRIQPRYAYSSPCGSDPCHPRERRRWF